MNKLLKEARLLLLDVRRNVTMPDRNEARIDKFLKATAQKAKPKSKGGRLRRAQKRTAQAEEMKAIREAVFARAGGFCEAGICRDRAVHMDHWLGGSGRRREEQSLETCWALCEMDHQCRTANRPSVAFWNDLFRLHCASHGYPFTPHITHAQLKRSAP